MTKKDNTELATVEPVGTLATARQVLASIPAVEDDPTPRMMEAILNAPDASSWEDLFEASHFKDMAGRKVRIHDFRWSPSIHKNALGVFFICDADDLE